MSVATLSLRISPRRMLSVREAAEYCGRPAKRFSLECPVSTVAFPNGDRLYDMQDLDIWIETLKSGLSNVDDIIDRLGT
jgi:hypothetical protein